MKRYYCHECGLSSFHHFNTWSEEITNSLSPKLRLPKRVDFWFYIIFEKVFSWIGLIEMREDFLLSDIQMRTACFINEARKKSIKFKAAKGLGVYTNYFCAELGEKKIRFEKLPIAEHVSKYDESFVDCKERTKKHLKYGGFPVPEGKVFWFWQKNSALKFANKLGFPLVVKPRGGSVARHVTVNIKNNKELLEAIDKSIKYSPVFIVERFIDDLFVYRATVVDFDFACVVKQVPANVVGDASSTIQQLIEEKNKEKGRGELYQKDFTLYKLVVDNTVKDVLKEDNKRLETVPKENETIYLQRKPFLKLGGDLVEVTNTVHADNIQLFKDVAKHFDIRLVGIDFIITDISTSWKTQECAILELNSVPCIEMHHFPSSGQPQNVAKALVDLFIKYYS